MDQRDRSLRNLDSPTDREDREWLQEERERPREPYYGHGGVRWLPPNRMRELPPERPDWRREWTEEGRRDFERDPRYGYTPQDFDRPPYNRGGWVGGNLDESELRRRPYAGKGPRNYRRTDARIHEEICERLTDHDLIDCSDIEIRVEDGEVILTGTIDDRRIKHLIEDTAAHVSGVSDVQNHIKVRRPS